MIVAPAFRRALSVTLALALLLVLGVPFAAAQDDSTARTFVDAVGREVTLEAPPQRVVGMSASINEMLFAVGVEPAGVTAAMQYPPAAAELPVFGSGYQPNLEALAALEPDLIIANAQLNMQILPQLEEIAPVIVVLTNSVQDVIDNVRLIGQVTWHDTSAEYLARTFEQFLVMADAVGASVDDAPSVLILVGTLDQPNYGKSATYLGDMLARLGAQNVADSEADAGPFPGYAQLNIEAILEADPDVIFTVTRGAPAPLPEMMAEDEIWSALTAVSEGRVYDLDPSLYVESPGPRFSDAMTELYNLLYGEM